MIHGLMIAVVKRMLWTDETSAMTATYRRLPSEFRISVGRTTERVDIHNVVRGSDQRSVHLRYILVHVQFVNRHLDGVLRA